MKKWIKKISLAMITYIIMQLVLYKKIHLIFDFPETPTLTFLSIRVLSIVFGISLLTALYTAIALLIAKNTKFYSFLKYFIPYGLIMGVFLLLTWPGIFKGDEFYVLRAALSFQLSPAQSGLTSLFYICCLLFFPSMATITLIQLLIICSIFAYIMKNLMELYHSKWIYLMYIPALLLPVIDGNLFTLRSTLVGWFFLLLLFQLFFSYQRKKQFNAPMTTTNYFSFLIISGLLCAWRSEFLYLILFLPAILFLFKLLNWKKALLAIPTIILCFCIWNVPNKIASQGCNKYPISLVLNPIANIFTEEYIEGPQVYEDILTINELVDVQLLRQSASVRNISQYWNIPDILPEEQLNRFMAASLRIILYNFDDFLKYRSQTFAYTNGFYKDRINHPGGEMVSGILNLEYYGEDYKTKFIMVNPILPQSIREKTIDFLACRHYAQDENTTNKTIIVFYNCVPTIILLLLTTILALWKRKFWFAGLSILCATQVLLIFLTAPAMFFMYYYSFYLSGYMLSALYLVELLSNPKTNSQKNKLATS